MPQVLIEVTADDDLKELVRETLSQHSDAGISIAGLHLGNLALQGRVATGQQRDLIITAVREEIPGPRRGGTTGLWLTTKCWLH